jgi:AcrR family transcriptional regulator
VASDYRDRQNPRRKAGVRSGGTPAQQRDLRAQGRRTVVRLLDAGLRSFETIGYAATRVDDIVRMADTSHGTFYLYFASKEDLLAALAKECAAEMEALADCLGPVGPGAEGRAELRAWVQRFVDVYRRYGPVVRAWSESQVSDPALARMGQRSLRRITSKLTDRIAEASRPPGVEPEPAAYAFIGMLERVNYFVLSRGLRVDDATAVDTLAAVLHTGVFGGRPGRRVPAGRAGRH